MTLSPGIIQCGLMHGVPVIAAQSVLSEFDWIAGVTAIADFLLIAAAIYFLLRSVRYTVGLPLLLSLGVLAVLYGFTYWAQFEATTRIVKKFAPVLAFALIVLFQDDIRRVILKANPNYLYDRFVRPVDTKAQKISSVVTEAAQVLVRKRLGALIVIDREHDLAAYMDESVTIDAELTRELLHAIFIDTHANPLHDGATVIDFDSGRIVAAACFLPLSTNPNIPLSMGTRHRAGIGLSEEADCLVIVVSEETGRLTICKDGEYARFWPKEQTDFRDTLRRCLQLGVRAEIPTVSSTRKGG